MQYKQVLLTRLSRCETLNHLKQVQALVTTLGHSQTQFYALKLLRFAAFSLCDLHYSRRIFDSLRSPNVFLFSAAIAAHSAARRHRAAFELYRQMLRRGVSRPNRFVYPQTLNSSAEALEPRAFGSVHAQIVKTGCGLDPVVLTGLVGLYAKAPSASVESARKVFDEMPQKSVVAWTALISGYVRAGEVGEALALFEAMPERDLAAWNAVISGSARNGLFSEAITLFKRLVSGYLECKEDGFRFRVRPDGVTITSVLPACGRGSCDGTLRLGKWAHGYSYRNDLVPGDPFVSNALVDMYGKCGSLRDAIRVFDAMPVKPSMVWNSMINSYAIHGRSEDAIRVFEEMVARDTSPDEITFVGLLNACAHGGSVDEGLAYFDHMTRGYGIKPRIEHYGCLIDLLGRAGRLDEAVEVVNAMGPDPDEVVWSSLLNGCKIHHRVDLAELAVQKLVEIDPASNEWYAITLANMYGESGKLDEFRKIRKSLREEYL